MAHSNEIATFLSSQYGSNGTFTNNLYGYSLANNPEWAQEKLSNLNAEYYFNNSNYIFNHVLETQLAESWSQLREIDPGELLPLFKDSSKDLEQTGRLISVALQSDQTVVATLQHLSNADDDFVMSLFSSLPDGYKTDYPEEALDLGAEKRQDRLRSLMGAHGTDPIGVAFADASRSASPEVFLTNWIYDDNIFNTSNLEGDNELRKTLKQSITNSENETAITTMKGQFGTWLDATYPTYIEQQFTTSDHIAWFYNFRTSLGWD